MNRSLALLLVLVLMLTACEEGTRNSSSLPAADGGGSQVAQAAQDGAGSVRPEPVGAGAMDPLDQPLPEVEVPAGVEAGGINPWVDASADPASTFGISPGDAAYRRIAQAVTHGYDPVPAEVRVEEVVNAFEYDYATGPDETFSLQVDGGTWPYASEPGAHLVRIGIGSNVVEVRDPANLIFVIDTSGSMEPHLPAVKDALSVLVDNLAPGRDTIAAVTYADSARPLLEATDVGDRARILAAVDSLQTSGSTNLADGLAAGYRVAVELGSRDADAAANTRVILLSDGIANTGTTDVAGILGLIADGRGTGIELLTVGFGLGGFNDPLMEQLANEGDGIAVYVDSPEQARDVFATDLTTTLQTIATEARTQVTFDPAAVSRYRLLGYENVAIADEDFRDDSVDASEIGAGHTVTALYEVVLAGAAAGEATTDAGKGVIGTVALRWLDPDTREATEISTPITVDAISGDWESADAGLRLAGNAAAWAEILRLSPYASTVAPRDLAVEAQRIADATSSPELVEFASLVGTWAR